MLKVLTKGYDETKEKNQIHSFEYYAVSILNKHKLTSIVDRHIYSIF